MNCRHDYGHWDYSESERYRIRICRKCGDVDIDPIEVPDQHWDEVRVEQSRRGED